MMHYIEVYMKHFDFATQSEMYCERCGSIGENIHHIYGRGKDKDTVKNLMCLCFSCHTLAHASKEYISKEEFQTIHDNFLRRHK